MTTSDYPGATGLQDAGTAGALDSATDRETDDGTGGAKEQAQQAAGAAADQGKHLASVAQGEVKNVAQEARTQVQGLMQQAGQELDGQSRQQKDRLAGTLRTFGDDLDGMASQGNDGMATQVAREVADRARSLSSHLEQRDPRELLDDVRDFARRRPGTFLAGAFAAGLLAGRLTRGAKAASSGDTDQVTGSAGSRPAPALTTATSTGADLGYVARPTPATPYAADVTSVRDPLLEEPTVTTSSSPDDVWTDASQQGGRP